MATPASAGPATKPSCCTVVFTATALTKISRGATSGSNAWRAGFSNDDASAITSTRP
jgi:hypothetical protein